MTAPAEARAQAERTAPSDLAGWRVLVPWSGERGERMARRVRARGGDPVLAELVRAVPPVDERPLDAALARLAAGDVAWLVLTSARAARVLVDHGATVPADTRVAAVGSATARAAQAIAGVRSDDVLVPADHSAAGLVAALPAPAEPGTTVVLPRSAQAHDTLARGLAGRGWTVADPVAYRMIGVALDQRVIEDVRRGALDATLVTSGTVARQIAIQFGAARTQTALVAMGPQTADDARAVGLEVAAVADPHDAEGLLDAVAGLAARGRRAAGATTISRSPRSHGRM